MTKYARTVDGKIVKVNLEGDVFTCKHKIVEEPRNNIEELCDEFVIVKGTKNITYMIEEIYEVACNEVEFAVDNYIEVYLYGAIWTDKGLIYVAKMNENEELELI